MTQQEEIDVLEKQIDSLHLLVDGANIKKALLEQIQVLRNAIASKDKEIVSSATAVEAKDDNKVYAGFEMHIHSILQKVDGLQSEITQLKEVLNLKENPSINYEKIKDSKVKKQLIADNVRMEQAKFDLLHYHDFHEEQAFRRYCTFAFFQIEQLLTYYFHHQFKSINELKADFKARDIKEEYFEKARKVSDLRSFILISAYIHTFFTSKNNPKSWGLDNLRDVRNLEEHRCAVVLKPENWRELEKQYNKLALPARRKLAIQNKTSFTLSKSEREIENEYYTMRFIRERNFDAVLDEIKNVYNNVTK